MLLTATVREIVYYVTAGQKHTKNVSSHSLSQKCFLLLSSLVGQRSQLPCLGRPRRFD